jgi:hypothetical protein
MYFVLNFITKEQPMSEAEKTNPTGATMKRHARETLMTIFESIQGLNRGGQAVDAHEKGVFDEALAGFIISYNSVHHFLFDYSARPRIPAWSVANGRINQDRPPDTADFLILTGMMRHFEERLGSDVERVGSLSTQISNLSWLKQIDPKHLDISSRVNASNPQPPDSSPDKNLRA